MERAEKDKQNKKREKFSSQSGAIPEDKHNTKLRKPKKREIHIENFPISDETLEKANQLGNKNPNPNKKGKPINPKKYNMVNKRLVPKPLIKLILNLLILAGLALLIKHSYQLFTSQPEEPLKESIILIVGLALWIAIIKLSKSRSGHYWLRYNWTKPSFKLTTLSVIIIILILTFAGVQPFADYKDSLIEKWEAYQAEQEAEEAAEQQIRQAELERIEAARLKAEQEAEAQRAEVARQEQLRAEQARKEAEEEAARIAGLRNPSWAELKAFLLKDDTDKMEYVYPIVVCADFADKLKRNAEEAGWRCGIVQLSMTGYTDPYNYGIASDAGHACNAFETTDKGLVFIDCTGLPRNIGSFNHDRIVDVQIGKPYNPEYIFPSGGWYVPSGQMGTVTGINIQW